MTDEELILELQDLERPAGARLFATGVFETMLRWVADEMKSKTPPQTVLRELITLQNGLLSTVVQGLYDNKSASAEVFGLVKEAAIFDLGKRHQRLLKEATDQQDNTTATAGEA